jgi:hypothetical protein
MGSIPMTKIILACCVEHGHKGKIKKDGGMKNEKGNIHLGS